MPKRTSPLITGAWMLAAFVAVCSIAAGHTTLGGIFPFVALVAAIAMCTSIGTSAER